MLKATIAELIYLNTFFLYMIVEQNKLDIDLCNAKSFLIFTNSLLKIGRPIQNPMLDPVGITYLLTRLRLGLSHLNDHKFRNNFQDCLTPLFVFVVLKSSQLFIISCIAIIIMTFVRGS